MSASNNLDPTLADIVASLAQLTIALHAHLAANEAFPNTTPLLPSQSTPTEPTSDVPSQAPFSTCHSDAHQPVVSPITTPPLPTLTPRRQLISPLPPAYSPINANIPITPPETPSVIPLRNPAAVAAALNGQGSREWYVVTIGKEPGVYSNWLITKPLVDKVPGNCYQKFDIKSDAIKAYKMAWDMGEVKRVV
ncbi:hypothetical protein BDZ94DRAFT_1050137 [Collybia nuda]|uniref:Ribonuclease H1 N-terminal domain-containing protein n=1 Tax=Collybia nuda TaxID=64659 RepID=A0A9P6CB77_9AGAR|nr:hypothetical protein BDZ94DRAFT_1050137 [Collybia nuda]